MEYVFGRNDRFSNRLDKKSGGSALIIMDACQKGKLKQAYELIKENPQMDLDRFVKKMKIEE